MKKLNWVIALLSVFSLTLVACGGDDVEPKKPAPTPPVAQSFDIQVDEITFNSANFIITPTVSDADYLCMLYDAASFEAIKERFFVKTLFQELRNEARAVGMTLSQYLAEHVDRGVSAPEYKNLAPESDYYVIVFGVDLSGECSDTTDLFKHKFTTGKAPVVDITFDIETVTDGTNATIKVTPSKYDTVWYYYLMQSSQYNAYIDPEGNFKMTPESVLLTLAKEQVQASMSEVNDYREAISKTFHICNEDYPSKTFNVSYLSYNTDYTHLVAGFVVDLDGNITLASPVYTETFNTGDIGEVDLTFDITVENIEALKASVKVVPSDLKQYFYWQIGRYDGTSSAEEVLKTIRPGAPYTGIQDYTGGPGSPYKMTLDAPDTEYFVIAFGYAPGAGITTEPTMVTFRTLPAPSAEETTFNVVANSNSISPYSFTIDVTASHSTTYYFFGITEAQYFNADTLVKESDAAMDEMLAYYRENYDPNYTPAQILDSDNLASFSLGNQIDVFASGLEPATTYMAYVCAMDVNTGHVAKVHTFENLATTKSLTSDDNMPTILSIKHYSGREEAGTIFENAAATEKRAIVVIEYGNLDNARSLAAYLSKGNVSDTLEFSDSYVWSTVNDAWDSVKIKHPYSFYLVDWDSEYTILSYVVDKSGLPSRMTREVTMATLENARDIEELRELVKSIPADKSATRFSLPQSLVVEE